jgi:hypothetical protein
VPPTILSLMLCYFEGWESLLISFALIAGCAALKGIEIAVLWCIWKCKGREKPEQEDTAGGEGGEKALELDQKDDS